MALELPSILITDDDFDFRDTVRGLLENQGFRTLLAGDGEEALEIVRLEPVHLLLLDMHMPRLTGLETLYRVKRLKARLPCILLSADADDELIEKALAADAFSVLKKPVSRAGITGTVHNALASAYPPLAFDHNPEPERGAT